MPCICGYEGCACHIDAGCTCPQISCTCWCCLVLRREARLPVSHFQSEEPSERHASRSISSLGSCESHRPYTIESSNYDPYNSSSSYFKAGFPTLISERMRKRKFSSDNGSNLSNDSKRQNVEEAALESSNGVSRNVSQVHAPWLPGCSSSPSQSLRNISQIHVPWLPGSPSSIASEHQSLDAKDLPVSSLVLPDNNLNSSNEMDIHHVGEQNYASTSATGIASLDKTNVGIFESGDAYSGNSLQRCPRWLPKKQCDCPCIYQQLNIAPLTREHQPGVNPAILPTRQQLCPIIEVPRPQRPSETHISLCQGLHDENPFTLLNPQAPCINHITTIHSEQSGINPIIQATRHQQPSVNPVLTRFQQEQRGAIPIMLDSMQQQFGNSNPITAFRPQHSGVNLIPATRQQQPSVNSTFADISNIQNWMDHSEASSSNRSLPF